MYTRTLANNIFVFVINFCLIFSAFALVFLFILNNSKFYLRAKEAMKENREFFPIERQQKQQQKWQKEKSNIVNALLLYQ